MNKKFHLALILFLFFSNVYSQTKSDSTKKLRGNIGLLGGYGQPILNFASTDVYKNGTGWAIPGFNLGAIYTHGIARNLSFVLSFTYNKNSVNTKVDQDALNADYPGYTFAVSSDPWVFKTALIGLQYALKFKGIPNLSISIKAMPGIMFATAPTTTWKVNSSQTGPYTVQLMSSDSKAFAYDVGLGLKYNINEALGVFFQTDYIASNPQFEDIRQIYGVGLINNTITNNPGNMNIQVINISFGICVQID